MDDRNKTSNMIKDTNILKAREGGGKSRKRGTRTKNRVSNGSGNTPE